jgi:Polysaccharide deacetylase
MDLLRAEFFRRRIYHWFIPPVSLWVLILFGLAFSSASVARAENTDPGSAVSPEGNPSRIRNSEPAARLREQNGERTTFDQPVPAEEHSQEGAITRELLIDGDPGLPASQLLPPRAAMSPPKLPLYVDGECQTPMSLMLHSSFGTERMRLLAREILVQGLRTTTYREITEGLRQGKCPASNSLVVSLDDFGTDWLRLYFQSMIGAFTDRGLRLVVAVNVHGPQDPDAWAYLRDFEGLGNEVANHTIDHLNLARLEQRDVEWQVKGAHQIICVNLGSCPETLLLPFGINDENGTVQSAAGGYSYIVGIPGGRSFEGRAPYYLGRIGPDNFDQRTTLRELAATFRIQPSAGSEFLLLRASFGRGCAAGPSPSIAMPLAFCVPSES